MNYNKALKKVEYYVNLLYTQSTDPRLFFHNYGHAREAVNAASNIADHYQLDERSRFVIAAATWFQATGYLVTKTVSCEEKSAELAARFLSTAGIQPEEIAEIKNCILATKAPQKPDSLAEKIVCDATMFFTGTDEFGEKNRLMKKENEAFENRKIGGNEWRSESIKILESHTYHTDYCKSLLDKPKGEYLDRLRSKQKEKLPERAPAGSSEYGAAREPSDNNIIENKAAEGSTRKKRPKRGIETMFRISSVNSMRISEMADAKAHIMISVNSIIISVVLGLLVKNLGENKNLIIPTIVLLAVNVTTIIYSVLATRPTVTKGVFTKQQVEDRSVNLIFFGNFYKMDFEEYDAGVQEMMDDSDFLYKSLRRDIYGQGKVLGRKYRLLHTSYSVFMYGILASVAAYAVAVLIEVGL